MALFVLLKQKFLTAASRAHNSTLLSVASTHKEGV